MKSFKKKTLIFLLAAMLAFGMAIPTQAIELEGPAEAGEQVSGGSVEGYVEGEAIVCVQESRVLYGRRNASDDDLLAGAETLMTLENSTGGEAGAVGEDGTADENGVSSDGDEASSDNAAVLFGAGSEAPVESLKLVKSDDLSTEELIEQLEELDQVVFAEPNYIYSVADTTSEDYTKLQWGYDTAPESKYDINIPGWNDTSSSSSAVDADDTVVAVLDSGVDYTHEDLKNVMWKASEDLQNTIGGGEYGYNAVPANSAGTPYNESDPMDDHSHGTHCAGIIAAEWNSYGVSGAAKGAKVMAVKIGSDRGSMITSNTIKGFEYVKRAKEDGVNVTVTSNSWGGGAGGAQSIDRVVTELGEMGVVSVFASGNETIDADINSLTGSMLKNNPYAVIVNATDRSGNLAYFSNYGAVTTDVAAPGLSILSTIPTSMAKMDSSLPTTAEPLKKNVDNSEDILQDKLETAATIENGSIQGKLFTYQATQGTANISDEKNYDEQPSPPGHSMKISPSADETLSEITVTPLTEEKLDARCKHISLQYYGDCSGNNYLAHFQAYVKDTNGNYQACPEFYGLVKQWNRGAIALPADTDYDSFEMKLEVRIIDAARKEYSGSVYIDDITLYGADAAAPYGYKSGTSMAAPAVAGEAAMVAKQFAEDKDAAKWAARIIGSVNKIDSHEGKSVSEGIVDVQKALNEEYVPVLNSAEAGENGTLTVEGYFFGKNKGTLTVSGQEVEAISWSDEKITAKVPAKLSSGVHKVEVTSQKGSGHQSFELALPGNLYERIALPDDEAFLSLDHTSLTGLGGSLYLSGYDSSGALEIWRYTPEQTKNRGWTRAYRGDNDALTIGVNTACTWEDQLVLMVQEFKAESVEFGDGRIGLFDPETGTMKMIEISEALDSMGDFSIINNGTDILLIGGNVYDAGGNPIPQKTVYRLDMEKGTIEKVGELSKERVSPAVAVTAEGDVYVAAGTDDNGYVDGLERISPDGTVTMVRENVLPPNIASQWESGQYEKYSFATVEGGMMLTGPAMFDENGVVTADVYTLDFDSGVFTATDKIVSTSRLFEPVATAYQNAFYVLGNTTNAPPHEKVFAVDRTVKTIAQPGDSYVPPKKPSIEDVGTVTDITTEEPGKGSGMDTGDRNDIVLWFCILITSLLILVVYGCQKKKMTGK